MFTGLSHQEFYSKFKTEDDCRQYLYLIKWKKGYACCRCGCQKAWKGRTSFHMRCQSCDYDESVTANTIFHKVKIPLKKAFGLVFQMTVPKNGRSSNDLAKEFNINPKTAYAFRKNAHKAIEFGLQREEDDIVDPNLVIDGITISHRESGSNGFQRIRLQLKRNKSGRKRKNLSLQANCFLPGEGEIDFSRLVGGKFKEEGARIILWNFKVWFTGTHHHCSLTNLKGYLNEFLFRHHYRHAAHEIWHQLIERFMVRKPSLINEAGT